MNRDDEDQERGFGGLQAPANTQNPQAYYGAHCLEMDYTEGSAEITRDFLKQEV